MPREKEGREEMLGLEVACQSWLGWDKPSRGQRLRYNATQTVELVNLMRRRLLPFLAPPALALLITGCRPSADAVTAGNAEEVEKASLALEKQKYIWDIEHGAFELEKKFGAAFTSTMSRRDAEALHDFFLPELSARILEKSHPETTDHGYLREVRFDAQSSRHAPRGERNSIPEAGFEIPGTPSAPHAEREGYIARSPGTLPADAASLASYLCAYFDEFAKVKKSKCRVLDLHAKDRDPQTGDWTMRLLITAVGEDAHHVPIEFASEHLLRCRYLTDEEIAAGKIVQEWSVLYEKFRYSQGPLFEEVTAAVKLDQAEIRDNWKIPVEKVRQYFSQMAVEDFDRDGFLDLAAATASGRWLLLKSAEGKEFVEVTSDVGIPQWSYEQPRSRAIDDEAFLATWIDFDNDSYPDLLLGDRLHRNREGAGFEDVTESSGLYFAYNPKGCVVADYDCDGLLDLYVLYQNPRERDPQTTAGWVGDDGSGAENHLWRNAGHGKFVNVTQAANAGGGRRQSFAAVWMHANGDHYPDLYVANDFGTNALLINQGKGRFRDIAESVGVADYATSMGVAAGDLSGDGLTDIYVANMFSKMGRRIIAHISAEDYPPGVYEQIKGSCAGNTLYTPDGGLESYREISEEVGVNQVGWAYAPALADFDHDGWLDIYATTGFLSFQPHKPDG
jgi:hypothetical protein